MLTDRPRLLLLADYHPDLGLRSFGGLQRTAYVLDALEHVGPCDVVALVRGSGAPRPSEAGLDVLRQRLRLAGVIRCSPEDARPDPPEVRPARLWPRKVRSFLEFANAYTGEFRRHASAAGEVRRLVESGAYSAVVCRHLVPAVMVGLGQCTPHLPVIVDMDDDPYETRLTGLKVKSRTLKQRVLDATALRRLRCTVASHLDHVDHVWLAKPADSRRYRRVHASRSVLPNMPNWSAIPETPAPSPDDSRSVLFVGILDYPPNRLGLIQFLDEAWPRVLAEVPDARLVVVGKAKPAVAGELSAHPNVSLAGFVPDLADAYGQAAFTICPVFQGGGTNIKVLESYAYERACVVPERVGAAFPELQAAGVLASSRTMEGLASWCIRLLREPSLRASMAQRGLALVRGTYSPSRFLGRVSDDVQSLIARRRGG